MEPKKRGRPLKADAKRVSMNVRMNVDLLVAIQKAAATEGVTPSEWLRRLAAKHSSA